MRPRTTMPLSRAGTDQLGAIGRPPSSAGTLDPRVARDGGLGADHGSLLGSALQDRWVQAGEVGRNPPRCPGRARRPRPAAAIVRARPASPRAAGAGGLPPPAGCAQPVRGPASRDTARAAGPRGPRRSAATAPTSPGPGLAGRARRTTPPPTRAPRRTGPAAGRGPSARRPEAGSVGGRPDGRRARDPAHLRRPRGPSDTDQGAQVRQGLGADPRDLRQLVDDAEPVVRRSPGEDLGRRDRTDAGQRVELLGGGRVQVEQATRAAGPTAHSPDAARPPDRRPRSAPRRRAPGRGWCRPRSPPRRSPPAARTASTTREPAGSSHDPGVTDLTDDMDRHRGRGRRGRPPGRDRRTGPPDGTAHRARSRRSRLLPGPGRDEHGGPADRDDDHQEPDEPDPQPRRRPRRLDQPALRATGGPSRSAQAPVTARRTPGQRRTLGRPHRSVATALQAGAAASRHRRTLRRRIARSPSRCRADRRRHHVGIPPCQRRAMRRRRARTRSWVRLTPATLGRRPTREPVAGNLWTAPTTGDADHSSAARTGHAGQPN